MSYLVEVDQLKKYFPLKKGIFSRRKEFVCAVDNVSFGISKGETLGLVGESGCGKTTIGRTIMKLIEPTSGNAFFDSNNLFLLNPKDLREIRKKIALVFQDPYSSLNPRMQVRDIIAEPLTTHTDIRKSKLRDKVLELLSYVGMGKEHMMRYPHQFSGGQLQRISVARALALNPSFMVLDEPTSALDVSVQAQVLNLLADLQETFNLTYLFISHNLSVVEHISHRVAIMYLGTIVEMGPTKNIFANPLHPYAKALLSAVPNPDPDHQQEEVILTGDVPSPVNIPEGCRFHTRCNYKMAICKRIEPDRKEKEPGHKVACHLY